MVHVVSGEEEELFLILHVVKFLFVPRELFTVCALAKSLDKAISQLLVVNTSSAEFDLAHKLQVFRLEDAHCYNPNDEAKIRAAIANGPGGTVRFTKLIRQIGLELQMSQQAPTSGLKHKEQVVPVAAET
jgi:hypothetical protein